MTHSNLIVFSLIQMLLCIASVSAADAEDAGLPIHFTDAYLFNIGDQITSIKSANESTFTLNGKLTQKTNSRIRMSGDKFRIDFSMVNVLDGQPITKESVIFDGEKLYRFDILSKVMYVTTSPQYSGDSLAVPPIWPFPIYCRLSGQRDVNLTLNGLHERQKLTQALGAVSFEKISDQEYKVFGKGVQDGYVIVKMKAGGSTPLPSSLEMYAKVSVVDKAGNSEEQVIKASTYTVSEVGTASLPAGKKLAYAKQILWSSSSSETVIKVTECLLNVPIDPDEFTPDLPSAERIVDTSPKTKK